jgi:exopolyphosphatase/guanosine-5'-triphosphate,3'-diphosphate pyrophosphatase
LRLAAIDIGTNSTRLIIMEFLHGDYKVIERDMITTRLGEGVDRNRCLSDEAISRTIKAVKKFKKSIGKQDVDEVNIVGTSALRDVKNKNKFSNFFRKQTGYNLKIIKGKKEAELIYKGVKTDLEQTNTLIIDIGGGSTEFIWSEKEKIKLKSYDIGAVRLTERYIPDPKKPIKRGELNNIKQEVEKIIEDLPEEKITGRKAIGVGGTITTLGAIDLGLTKYDSEKIHCYNLNYHSIKKILNKVAKLRLIERENLVGLDPKRADIIIAGNIILKAIMEKFTFSDIMISERDILFGIIEELR